VAVIHALEAFLDGRDLDARERVLAEVARALAGELDAACSADTARSTTAVPPLARRLAEVLDALAEREAGEAADAVREAEREEQRERRRRAGRWVEHQNGGT
jgi:hypothetical protein